MFLVQSFCRHSPFWICDFQCCENFGSHVFFFQEMCCISVISSLLRIFFILIVVNRFSVRWAAGPSMDLSSSKDGESHHTKSVRGSLLSGRSKSRNGDCALSEYSKPYVLFSATNATSAAIDFSRKSMDDGV